ncbi:MAG: ferric reductase-like transmembrane domain-containing protein, partial [Janthinobacterium lividum]
MLAWTSVVAVVLLWLVRQGPRGLTELVPALGSLGLLTGLLSAQLLLLQVFLLARIPWVERAWGHDVLVRRHGRLGFASFALMLVHVVAFTAERLLRDDSASWAPLWSLFVTASWMLWASGGTLLIIGVTLTSVRAVRRRLRYESWHLLHLYGYLGVGLALPHQILDGSDFQSALASRYWWSVWGLAAGSVLVFRIGLPLWRSATHRLRVASVSPEGAGVVSVVVEGRVLRRLGTRSGQFFVWRFLDGPGWMRGHPYTISAAPTDDRLRITVQAAGDGGDRAARLQPGTRVLVEGPYGTMTAERRRHPGLLALAAGVGITPIRALLEDTPYAPGEAVLVYRCSGLEHEIFVAELAALAEQRGVRVVHLPGSRRTDGSWRPGGLDDEVDDVQALRDLVPD